MIEDWPRVDSFGVTAGKVPSTISYQNGEPYHWGYAVGSEEQSFNRLKSLLKFTDKDDQMPNEVTEALKQFHAFHTSPELVVTDYLRLIWEYTQKDIGKILGDDWDFLYTLKIVLTVPAIWSYSAVASLKSVAVGAGLGDNLALTTELEAAALAYMRTWKEDDNSPRVGDSFVVCNAGSTTVDVITYKVVATEPSRVEEYASGDGSC